MRNKIAKRIRKLALQTGMPSKVLKRLWNESPWTKRSAVDLDIKIADASRINQERNNKQLT